MYPNPFLLKTRGQRLLLVLGALMALVLTVPAQTMKPQPITSRTLNVKLNLPRGWKSQEQKTDEGTMLNAFSPGHTVDVYVQTENNGGKLEDFFGKTMARLRLNVQGKVLQEVVNGIRVLRAEGRGRWNAESVGVVMLCGAYKDYRYAVFAVTDYEDFETHRLTMSRILNSVAPLN